MFAWITRLKLLYLQLCLLPSLSEMIEVLNINLCLWKVIPVRVSVHLWVGKNLCEPNSLIHFSNFKKNNRQNWTFFKNILHYILKSTIILKDEVYVYLVYMRLVTNIWSYGPNSVLILIQHNVNDKSSGHLIVVTY